MSKSYTVPGDTMAIWDFFGQQYIEGKVLDKYRLENGNVGLIVQNTADNRRYHVEFKARDSEPGLNNLYGLLKPSFGQQSASLDKLITEGDYIGVTLTYNRSPFKQAQRLHAVSSKPIYRQRPMLYSHRGAQPAHY